MRFTKAWLALVLLVTAGCASSGSGAQIASASDVKGCRPLGEVVVTGNPGDASTRDPRTSALREKAAEDGATDVVPESSTSVGSDLKGQMYKCHEEKNSKPPSRSEQRSGF
jgi:hypothetical protein